MTDACVIVPAYEAARSLPAVLADLRAHLPDVPVLVIDDGSTDGTADVARAHGAEVLPSAGPNGEGANNGKGAALKTGLRAAAKRGLAVAVTVDADGQHPASEATKVLGSSASRDALVLGVRDLAGAGAPKANQFSNGFSNWFLSRFTGQDLNDTQCGLRRYPVAATLALPLAASGYDLEAEVIMKAIHARIPVVEEPVRVLYPADRVTHFRVSRDPWRILGTILRTYGGVVADRVRR